MQNPFDPKTVLLARHARNRVRVECSDLADLVGSLWRAARTGFAVLSPTRRFYRNSGDRNDFHDLGEINDQQ
jgi:hypothetical protein